MRTKTPSFVAEFALRTSAADEAALSRRFDAARQIYNASLGEALRRLVLMRESKNWQRASAVPKTIVDDRSGKRIANKERSSLFRKTQERFGFTSASIQKFAEACRDACSIGEHLGSHDTQTTSLRAFKAVQGYAFGERGRPRFKPVGRFHSVEGKCDAVIRFRNDPLPSIHWSGLVLPLLLDPKDKRGWQRIALACRTKYARIIRRTIRGRFRWFCQLVQAGLAPQVRPVGEDVVGFDLGPSAVACVSETEASLETLCPEVEQPWRETRRILRAMDRSRRATNPGNYDGDGRVKRGAKRWKRSGHYREKQRRLAETERRLAATRKTSQGNLANRILAQGRTLKGEKLGYRSWQKNFGRSVKVRAPGMLVERIRRKAESAGGGLIEIDPRKTRLSQFDHTTETYTKKPLSQRMHLFGDGVTEPVQRDLYSAFLATCCTEDFLDIDRVRKTWPGAEPLLRRAMSRTKEPARGKGFAPPPRSQERQSRSPVEGAWPLERGRGCCSASESPLALAMGRVRLTSALVSTPRSRSAPPARSKRWGCQQLMIR